MRRILIVLLIVSALAGCGKTNTAMERALNMRSRLSEASKCTFDLRIKADYVDSFYEFGLMCDVDGEGNINFCVSTPESISGITGRLSATGGELIFDDKVLLFPMMANGELSPVSAPWLLVKALRSGYIEAAGLRDSGLIIQIDDNFNGNTFQMNIVTDALDNPASAEVIWKDRGVLTMFVENFQIM